MRLAFHGLCYKLYRWNFAQRSGSKAASHQKHISIASYALAPNQIMHLKSVDASHLRVFSGAKNKVFGYRGAKENALQTYH